MFERYNPANWTIAWEKVAVAAMALGLAIFAAWLAYSIIFAILHRVTRMSESPSDDLVIDSIKRPVKWSLVAIAVTLVAQADATLAVVWEPLAQFVRPALLGWIAAHLAADGIRFDGLQRRRDVGILHFGSDNS